MIFDAWNVKNHETPDFQIFFSRVALTEKVGFSRILGQFHGKIRKNNVVAEKKICFAKFFAIFVRPILDPRLGSKMGSKLGSKWTWKNRELKKFSRKKKIYGEKFIFADFTMKLTQQSRKFRYFS